MIKTIVTGSLDTNSYLIINEDKCILIDPAFKFEEAAEISNTYKVEKIIITHGHLDHIDAIRYFDAPIYISKEDSINLKDNTFSCYSFMGLKNPMQNLDLNVNLLKDEDELDIFGKKMKCYLTNGHTKGSMVFLYKDILFTGDTLFFECIGRTDLPGGNPKDMQKSILKIFSTFNDNIKVYPGHGKRSTIKYEKQNNTFYLNYLKRK